MTARRRRPGAGARAGRCRRPDHARALPRHRPGGRDQARPDAGERGRHGGRAGAARAARGGAAGRRRSWARSTASSETPATAAAAGSSTRSTAPRTTCAGSRCGRRCSRSQEDGEVDRRGRLGARAAAGAGGRRAGAGAFVRDGADRRSRAALGVSGVRALEDAQLCCRRLRGWEELGRLDAAARAGPACWRTRGFGDFWGYMLVAEGVAEIGCEAVVSLWDLAAPQVIVEEAGGRFTDLGGAQPPTAATRSPPTACCTRRRSRSSGADRGRRG